MTTEAVLMVGAVWSFWGIYQCVVFNPSLCHNGPLCETTGKAAAYLVRLPTPPRRIFSMTITNSCAAGREMPRTNNQSNHIHDDL